MQLSCLAKHYLLPCNFPTTSYCIPLLEQVTLKSWSLHRPLRRHSCQTWWFAQHDAYLATLLPVNCPSEKRSTLEGMFLVFHLFFKIYLLCHRAPPIPLHRGRLYSRLASALFALPTRGGEPRKALGTVYVRICACVRLYA